MLVGQRGGYSGRAREESLPQYIAPSFSISPSVVPAREPSRSGEPCHPPDASPLVLRIPGPLPPPNVVPPERQPSPVAPFLPGAASRYSRIPVSPPPSPRCIAAESILADILTHWRSMPRSRERRRPQPPTFPTPQPPCRSQTRALGRGEATSTSDATSVASDETRPTCDDK